MKFTPKIPNKTGYYWYCNFGEHTPTILRVTKDYSSRKLWASDEEFSFPVKKEKKRKLDEGEELIDGYAHGEELWCYIECPTLPNGKKLEPSCY
jgi:hypothetical protein